MQSCAISQPSVPVPHSQNSVPPYSHIPSLSHAHTLPIPCPTHIHIHVHIPFTHPIPYPAYIHIHIPSYPHPVPCLVSRRLLRRCLLPAEAIPGPAAPASPVLWAGPAFSHSPAQPPPPGELLLQLRGNYATKLRSETLPSKKALCATARLLCTPLSLHFPSVNIKYTRICMYLKAHICTHIQLARPGGQGCDTPLCSHTFFFWSPVSFTCTSNRRVKGNPLFPPETAGWSKMFPPVICCPL